jgi:hypothetical protein
MERLVPFIAYLKVSIFTSKWKLSASTSITGNVSGVANISNVIIKTYAIGDKAIWGGYSWTNLATLGILILVSFVRCYKLEKDVYDENKL